MTTGDMVIGEQESLETEGFVIPAEKGDTILHPAIHRYIAEGKLSGDIAFKKLTNVWTQQPHEKQLRGFANYLKARSPVELHAFIPQGTDIESPVKEVFNSPIERKLPIMSTKSSAQHAADLIRIHVKSGFDVELIKAAITEHPEELAALLNDGNPNALQKVFASCHPSIRQYRERGELGKDERYTKEARKWNKLPRDKQVKEFSRWVEKESPGELRVLVAQGLIKL